MGVELNMPTPWEERNPEEYARQRAEVRRAYPQLHFFADPDVRIRGGFPITVSGRVLDRFHVEMRLCPGHPTDVPRVWETEGRIPRIIDRHMSPDGEACLFLPEETLVQFPPGSTLLDYLQGPVNAFFIGQLHFDEFGTWPFGEWRHGSEGTIDYYAKQLGIHDAAVIMAFLEILRRKEMKGHWECPCGSGEKLRRCHGPTVAALRAVITPTIAAGSYDRLTVNRTPQVNS